MKPLFASYLGPYRWAALIVSIMIPNLWGSNSLPKDSGQVVPVLTKILEELSPGGGYRMKEANQRIEITYSKFVAEAITGPSSTTADAIRVITSEMVAANNQPPPRIDFVQLDTLGAAKTVVSKNASDCTNVISDILKQIATPFSNSASVNFDTRFNTSDQSAAVFHVSPREAFSSNGETFIRSVKVLVNALSITCQGKLSDEANRTRHFVTFESNSGSTRDTVK